jgi:hypothetical protein
MSFVVHDPIAQANVLEFQGEMSVANITAGRCKMSLRHLVALSWLRPGTVATASAMQSRIPLMDEWLMDVSVN